jgi:hypothetical protein
MVARIVLRAHLRAARAPLGHLSDASPERPLGDEARSCHADVLTVRSKFRDLGGLDQGAGQR